MAVYGISQYGAAYYGYDLPPAYRVDPFIATSINYSQVLVSWTPPSGNISAWRLVKNRYGFPVDQDDGELLIDSLSFPGQQFIDTNVVPGEFQYYGFFVLISAIGTQQTWVRSGWTACLATNNYNSGLEIHTLMPTFYHLQGGSTNETVPSVPNFPSEVLDYFCVVLGWGVDYLKTQYDTYLNVNNPWKVPVHDLYNLAAQFGININPDIHPYTLRKAVYYNAVINQQRGTVPGLTQELEALTGWAADLTLANNFMLENDQSAFTDPSFPLWSANINYNVNEYVQFGNYFYQCANATNIGNQPSGTTANNTWWNSVTSLNATSYLLNAATGKQNTWELINTSVSNGRQSTNGFFEIVGIQNPLNAAQFTSNGLLFTNTSGSTATLLARSVSRVNADVTTNGPNFPPNKDQAVGDGIPVPFVVNSLVWNGTTWNSTTRFGTRQIATYNNVPFIALRASTNVTPPYTSRATVNNEWAPVSLEPRFRICLSGYFSASTSGITVTPFAEWYDSNGNFIMRTTARNATAGSNTLPSGLFYDSFTYPSGTGISGRTSDDCQGTWTLRKGFWHVSGFSDGCIYPFTSSRSYATITSGVSNCQVGITFITAPATGDVQGLILRWQDDNNYLRASMTELDLKQSGVFTTLGTYSTPANVGDRLVVQLNGSTITVFINNIQVLTTTSSFNTSGTIHGIINEGSVVVTNPGPQSNPEGQQV